jgi:hypothetical protein
MSSMHKIQTTVQLIYIFYSRIFSGHILANLSPTYLLIPLHSPAFFSVAYKKFSAEGHGGSYPPKYHTKFVSGRPT